MTLFSATELEQQIAAYKAALLVLATGKPTKIGDTEYIPTDTDAVRRTLRFLEIQRRQLSGSAGLARNTGRPVR